MPPKALPGGSRSILETSLTRGLRYELASEEGRALLGSSAVSTTIGILWVLLVIFGPRTTISHLLPVEDRPISVRFEEPPPPPPPPPPAQPVAPAVAPLPAPKPAAPTPSTLERAKEREAKRVAQIGAAFGGAAPQTGNGPVGDVSNVLRGVDVHASGAPTPGGVNGGKTVIAYGQGGEGVRTPGRTDMEGAGGAGTTTGIGTVGAGGGGIGHAAVVVSAPRAVAGGTLPGRGRDVGALGTAVRQHEPQLRFCYEEYGLKANPQLAGSITLALTMDAMGAITRATISERTWSGAGVTPTESCILDRAQAWRFPDAAGNAAGTYEFSFNFTN